jgi:hypothetical protein
MDSTLEQLEQLTTSFTSLQLNKDEVEPKQVSLSINVQKIIKIQSWFRGCIYRLKHLPLIMYKIQKYLKTTKFACSTENDDGRVNSCIDEPKIIKLLIEKFGNRIKLPESNIVSKTSSISLRSKKNTEPIKKKIIRMWYDILAYDYTYGWIPINIKTSTMKTSDNLGNLTTSVYAYTDEPLDLHTTKTYENGKMSIILFDKLKAKKYNKSNKKDYYFLVLNKTIPGDIVVNSMKGLSILTPNINNLPFQICWNKNRDFHYEHIDKKIKLFITCLQKPKPVWSESFMANIRTLKL